MTKKKILLDGLKAIIVKGVAVLVTPLLWWVPYSLAEVPLSAERSPHGDASSREARASIELETLLPERALIVPAKEPGATTPVRLGVRATNNTQMPVRFARDSFTPELRDASDEDLFNEELQFSLASPRKEDFPLVRPGESFTLFWDGDLYWSEDKLIFVAYDRRYASSWSSGALKHSKVKIRWNYNNTEPQRGYYDDQEMGVREVERVWAEKICGSWVELSLVPL